MVEKIIKGGSEKQRVTLKLVLPNEQNNRTQKIICGELMFINKYLPKWINDLYNFDV